MLLPLLRVLLGPSGYRGILCRISSKSRLRCGNRQMATSAAAHHAPRRWSTVVRLPMEITAMPSPAFRSPSFLRPVLSAARRFRGPSHRVRADFDLVCLALGAARLSVRMRFRKCHSIGSNQYLTYIKFLRSTPCRQARIATLGPIVAGIRPLYYAPRAYAPATLRGNRPLPALYILARGFSPLPCSRVA